MGALVLPVADKLESIPLHFFRRPPDDHRETLYSVYLCGSSPCRGICITSIIDSLLLYQAGQQFQNLPSQRSGVFAWRHGVIDLPGSVFYMEVLRLALAQMRIETFRAAGYRQRVGFCRIPPGWL